MSRPTDSAVFPLIQALLRQPIAFHRVFADIAGGACPGLFLSQAWYWSQRTQHPEGWFYKTQEEWQRETSLTRREQDTARLQLKRTGVLEEQRRGLPATIWYKINIGMLQTRLYESANLDCTKAPIWIVQNVQTSAETTTEITNKDPSVSLRETSSPLMPTELMTLYNTHTPATHPKITRLTQARTKKATQYLRQFPERSFWEAVCAEIVQSAFLRGERPSNGHEAFRGTFDWLLSKGKDGTENCIKVYEGKYRDGGLVTDAQQQRAITFLFGEEYAGKRDTGNSGDDSGPVS